MKILGIDYGEKRIGLAISDESRTFARELEILSPKEFWQRISSLAKEEEVERMVLGWPINMAGKETKKTREVEKFRIELEKACAVPVDVMDERLTSVMAHNLPGGKKNVDSLAAQILLQNYLDKHKHQNS
ncbi:MAG: Holliday junction resolvase RuvX [Patescibacteria group bacterium]|nr:Holliday junction resolvase RuvX [Patescibacteria group bacterium]